MYQTESEPSENEDDFGLQWYLKNRIDEYVAKIWSNLKTEKFLTNMFNFIQDKIKNCTKHCMICGDRLEFELLKPYVCDKEICLFGYG